MFVVSKGALCDHRLDTADAGHKDGQMRKAKLFRDGVYLALLQLVQVVPGECHIAQATAERHLIGRAGDMSNVVHGKTAYCCLRLEVS